MQASKTFNIGEYAKGGVITVEIKGKVIIVIGKEWDFSAGSKKTSDQSNAKEFIRGTTLATEYGAKRQIEDFLNDLTTSYYSDQVVKWIESKVKLDQEHF